MTDPASTWEVVTAVATAAAAVAGAVAAGAAWKAAAASRATSREAKDALAYAALPLLNLKGVGNRRIDDEGRHWWYVALYNMALHDAANVELEVRTPSKVLLRDRVARIAPYRPPDGPTMGVLTVHCWQSAEFGCRPDDEAELIVSYSDMFHAGRWQARVNFPQGLGTSTETEVQEPRRIS